MFEPATIAASMAICRPKAIDDAPIFGPSAAEDGGGETFLPREEWAKPRGRKSHRRRCGIGDRGAAVLWPDQAIRGRVARVGPTALRRRRGGNRVTRTRGRPHGAKEKKPWRADGRDSMSRQPARQRPHSGSCRIHRDAASVASERCSDRAVVTRWWRSETGSVNNHPRNDERRGLSLDWPATSA
jgi:hypothetical protein